MEDYALSAQPLAKLKLSVQQKAFLKSTLKMRQHLPSGEDESKSSSSSELVDMERELDVMTNPM